MSKTISDEYREVLRRDHGLWQGTKAWHKSRWKILDVIDDCGAESVLDFGAANGGLTDWLLEQRPHLTTYDYDPRFHDEIPGPADLVVSTDVLEHVEPELVPDTLGVIADLAQLAQFHCICTRKAGAVLPDGRNAHLTVWPAEKWVKAFRYHQPDWLVVPLPYERPHIIEVTSVPASFRGVRDIDDPYYKRWHEASRKMLKEPK